MRKTEKTFGDVKAGDMVWYLRPLKWFDNDATKAVQSAKVVKMKMNRGGGPLDMVITLEDMPWNPSEEPRRDVEVYVDSSASEVTGIATTVKVLKRLHTEMLEASIESAAEKIRGLEAKISDLNDRLDNMRAIPDNK